MMSKGARYGFVEEFSVELDSQKHQEKKKNKREQENSKRK